MSFMQIIESFFNETGKLKTIKRGAHLYESGEDPQYLYFLKKGLIGLVIMAESGNEHLVRLFRTGQLLGHRALFTSEKYHANALTLEESQVLFVEKKLVIDMLEKKPAFAMAIIQIFGKELAFAERRMVSLTEKDVTARVAEALIYLKDLYPDYRWTRKEISDFCASTTPTVIKVMARLEEGGYISQNGRDFNIVDREGLLTVCQCEL